MADYVPYNLPVVAGLGTDWAKFGDVCDVPRGMTLSEFVFMREVYSGFGGEVQIEPDGEISDSLTKIEVIDSVVVKWFDRGRSTSLIAGALE